MISRARGCFLVALLFLSLTPLSPAQEPAIKPNDALILENIPPIPASIAEKAAKYTDYRTATMYGWHPMKREILIGTRFADTVQVHQVATPAGARTQMTFFGDRVTDASYQPHKGDFFLFRKDVGGGEWYQIFRFDVATGDVTMLTDGKSRNSEFIWSNKGDRIAYAGTLRNNADLDFYVIDPAAKPEPRKPLAENQGGGWQVRDWSPDDRTLLATEYISINESHLWAVDVASGTKKRLTPEGQKVAYQPIGFSRDGKGVYVATDKDGEFQRLAYMDMAGGELKYLNNDPWDVEEAALSEDRQSLAYVVNENGLSTLHVLDLKPGKPRSLPKLPTGQITALHWSENNRDVAFSLNSAQSPSDVYSVDVQTAKLDRWTYSETGGVPSQNFVEPKLVKWKSFDGKEISGWLYAPKVKPASGKYPVVINIHGGPEGQSRPGFLGRTNYWINELGAVVIYPNVRGSTGYGKTFSQLDNGFLRENTYKDIGALLDWIGQQPDLDSQRVMVTGGSYGGHMTLAVATRYSSRLACSVDVVGISNLVTFLEHTESYRRDLRRVEYGDERDPKMRAYLESIAPMNHVKDITKPMMVVAGVNDPRVPKSESDQIVKSLEESGTPVWYLAAKDEGHGFQKKKNADFQFYTTVLFMRRYLLAQ
ncbi:MAG TPA: S9 family peptidase [Candidatus Binatia bacterium]|nr:S9 family peptidase [Candidatus Binatia bacterium]